VKNTLVIVAMVLKFVLLYVGMLGNPTHVTFWTSGYSRGGGKFVWCPTGQTEENFKASSLDAENCLATLYSDKAAKLLAENCSYKHNFICEVMCEKKFWINYVSVCLTGFWR
jgi:hypothetical protein